MSITPSSTPRSSETALSSTPLLSARRFARADASKITGHDCTICLETFDETDPTIIETKCAHVFHQACLDGWINTHAGRAEFCPMCRTPLFEQVTRVPLGTNNTLILKLMGGALGCASAAIALLFMGFYSFASLPVGVFAGFITIGLVLLLLSIYLSKQFIGAPA